MDINDVVRHCAALEDQADRIGEVGLEVIDAMSDWAATADDPKDLDEDTPRFDEVVDSIVERLNERLGADSRSERLTAREAELFQAAFGLGLVIAQVVELTPTPED